MMHSVSDDELEQLQAALQDEAATILTEFDESGVFADLGPLLPTGSYVSSLMTWPEIDVMLLCGHTFTPPHVFDLLKRVVEIPGLVDVHYTDERGPRAPTDATRDHRYHVSLGLERTTAGTRATTSTGPSKLWRIDLSLWLHDDHANVTSWHEALRDSITSEQRRAVLRIKDAWHQKASYPSEVGGLDVYTAVLDAGVRTPREFGAWLAAQGLPHT